MRVSVVLWFALQVSGVIGRLTVLRGKEQTRRYTHGNRKLLCVSEDDDGALVWNGNLNWLYRGYELSDRGGNTDFQRLNAYQKGEIDCDLNSYDSCTSAWVTAGWSLTNSKNTPMGPVFDRRWEGFREHNNFERLNEYRLVDKFAKSGAFAFSIRGSTDAHVLMCDGEIYENDFCYWIIIGGWSNTESVIRKCAKGVPDPMTYPIEPTCAEIRASYFYETLSSTEWRTFVVVWNESTRSISVYDTDKLLMTYVDNEGRARNRTHYYSLFLRSSKTMLFRFHIYSFLHTTDPTATLISPEFNLTNKTLCIELIIGLCKECQMVITLVDPTGENEEVILDTIIGSTRIGAHGLATWQHVRINRTTLSNVGRIGKIKLMPRLEQKSANPLWAVANVRECPPVGTVRYGSMEATQDYADYKYFWPNVTCQKLFYKENVVVNSALDVTFDTEFEDLHCPARMIGPHCSINCYSRLQNDADCRGMVVCERNGCTCPSGFVGRDCQSNCHIGQYGYGCKQTCGWCQGDNCDFATGRCRTGCDNSKRYNIPPFCKIGIDALPPPDIDFINETVVRAVVPVQEEYRSIPIAYRFIVQKEGKTEGRFIGDYTEILNATATMIGYADDLESGIAYQIACILYTNDNVSIHGKWKNFTTRCTPTKNFRAEAKNTSLTLMKIQDGVTYDCPDKWYELVFENVETQTRIKDGFLEELPYEFTHLTPYTLYKITIGKGTAILFSREIRTLEGVPSQVRNVRKVVTQNGDVTLRWDPPSSPNGMITKYEVVLQVQMHFGCENWQDQPRSKDTESISTILTYVTLSDLKPYAHYVAKITAYTSYRGPEETIEFSTNQTEIPTETFANLRIQDYTLTWESPKDCTTISGPIVAKIIVNGVDKSMSNFSVTKQTTKHFIDLNDTLYGSETYEARIYVIRGYHKPHNEQLYERLVFTTPPKAPPPVRDLQIFEIDSSSMLVHLRWQEPEPPTNGKIEHYVVSACRLNCTVVLRVLPTEYCDLWNGYICATIASFHQRLMSIKLSPSWYGVARKTDYVLDSSFYNQVILKGVDIVGHVFVVSAKNVNVSMPGAVSSVSIDDDEIPLDAPEIITATPLDKGVVNFTWSHPWRSHGRLTKFLIISEVMSSRLRTRIHRAEVATVHEHPVTSYRPRYNQQLRLLPSTTYKITVQAVTNTGIRGQRNTVQVRTPSSMGFEKELRSETRSATSRILLHIPKVTNDTRNSVTTVLVEGPTSCNYHARLNPYLGKIANIKHHENIWRIFTFSTEQFAGKTFTIDYQFNKDEANCSLKPEESYVIVVIVQSEEGSIDEQDILVRVTSIRIDETARRHEAWLVLITLILIVGIVAFLLYRRRRRRRSSKKIVLRGKMRSDESSERLEQGPSSSSPNKPFTAISTPSDKELLLRANAPGTDAGSSLNGTIYGEELSSLVKTKDFEDYVKHAIQSGLLDSQYNSLPRGPTKPWEYGKLPENKSKNRYGNLQPYDETRVVLKKLPDDPFSDYINANYIKGHDKERRYIATQGPKSNTVMDFWRMVWQEEVLVICMLTNTKEGDTVKCEQYWPDVGKKKKYGDLTVYNARQTVLADFTFRTLHVSCGDEARKIEHLHYTAWPDHGVPLSTHTVVTFLKKVLATPSGDGPTLIHCSAGAGRTGTIILCDICLRKFAAEGAVNVYAEFELLRTQRANMVDNVQQYRLAHLTMVECLFSLSTSLPCDDLLRKKIVKLKKQLNIQRDSLERLNWQDQVLSCSISLSLSERNVAKHRCPELAAGNFNRLYLMRYPANDEHSDYLAAVQVDGMRQQNQYVATQLPLPCTLNDFWRMIAEYKVELIVLLQPPDPKDTTCCPIVPNGEFKPVPYINVRSQEFLEYESYTSQKLILIDNQKKPAIELPVTILCSTTWTAGKDQDPPDTRTLLTLWQAAEKTPRGEGPIVVACHNGVTGCGLYLALSYLLERMTVERECDVWLAIRAIRRSRPDFVKSLEHMEYLYDAVITYLEYFETYANFL